MSSNGFEVTKRVRKVELNPQTSGNEVVSSSTKVRTIGSTRTGSNRDFVPSQQASASVSGREMSREALAFGGRDRTQFPAGNTSSMAGGNQISSQSTTVQRLGISSSGNGNTNSRMSGGAGMVQQTTTSQSFGFGSSEGGNGRLGSGIRRSNEGASSSRTGSRDSGSRGAGASTAGEQRTRTLKVEGKTTMQGFEQEGGQGSIRNQTQKVRGSNPRGGNSRPGSGSGSRGSNAGEQRTTTHRYEGKAKVTTNITSEGYEHDAPDRFTRQDLQGRLKIETEKVNIPTESSEQTKIKIVEEKTNIPTRSSIKLESKLLVKKLIFPLENLNKLELKLLMKKLIFLLEPLIELE